MCVQYVLNGLGLNPDRRKRFCSPKGLYVPASGYGGSFGIRRPGRESDHSPSSQHSFMASIGTSLPFDPHYKCHVMMLPHSLNSEQERPCDISLELAGGISSLSGDCY